jgi:capsid protein
MTTATAQRPRILGPDGRPIEAKPTRARILAQVGSDTPYGAASRTSQELAGWNAYLGSPDADLAERETIVARIRDLVRNDGWASGSVSRLVDAAVGADLRPSPKPDFRSLAYWSRGFDPEWAAAFASWAKGCWRDWAYDPARWCSSICPRVKVKSRSTNSRNESSTYCVTRVTGNYIAHASSVLFPGRQSSTSNSP